MKTRIVSILLVLVLCAALVPAALADNNTTMTNTAWVVTKNKGTLNMRSSMSTTENNIIAVLDYGSAVTIHGYYNSGAWAAVQVTRNNQKLVGYVMTAYLSFTNPGVTPTPTPAPSVDTLNFSSFTKVTPYYVYSNPDRATGWVNLRWAPSTAVDVIERCYQYYQLIVIAQNNSWAQVYDPATGVVGFISRNYIKNLGYGASINIAKSN